MWTCAAITLNHRHPSCDHKDTSIESNVSHDISPVYFAGYEPEISLTPDVKSSLIFHPLMAVAFFSFRAD